MNKLSKIKVLIIDDFCIAPMSDPERRDLLEVLEDRQSISSTIIATQVPIENWIEQIGDPTLADAILDRSGTQRPQDKIERRVHAKNPFVLDEIRQLWEDRKNPASLRSDQVDSLQRNRWSQ